MSPLATTFSMLSCDPRKELINAATYAENKLSTLQFVPFRTNECFCNSERKTKLQKENWAVVQTGHKLAASLPTSLQSPTPLQALPSEMHTSDMTLRMPVIHGTLEHLLSIL
jgi:hypothetical protein